MKSHKLLNIVLLLALLLAACSAGNAPADNAPAEEPAVEAPAEEPAVEAPADEPAAEEPAADAGYEWPAPIEEDDELSRTPVTEEELATFTSLDNLDFPKSDSVALAYAFGLITEMPPPPPAEAPAELEVGAVQQMWLMNSDTFEWVQYDFTLMAKSEHAYFWLANYVEYSEPERFQLAADQFEEIYELDRSVYGSEPNPGIDGDPHIYVLHVDGTAICNVAPDSAHQCGIAGYFSSVHGLPNEVEPHSNEHEIFVMNVSVGVGGENYFGTFIHEFRHMIESNYARNVDGWASEGTAVMAQTLIGDWYDPNLRASEFTANTDLQLNAWTQGNTIPHYGKGYLFTRYILARIGDEAYSDWVQRDGRSFFVIDETLQAFGFEFTAMDLWLDWTAAVSLIGVENVPAEYGFGEGDFRVDSPALNTANRAPADFEDNVRQYGFDIYDVRNNAPVTIDFTGTTRVQLIENTLPASGQYVWYSGRANETTMTLTREFDLSAVDAATLEYAVLYKIETGWDFAYALVSTNGGETWEALVGTAMESDEAGDDTGDLSLAATYYTGRSSGWEQESIDLTPYVGQTVLIRFQYVTDLAYNDPGMLIDNIAIPEIDFYDDTEGGENGWVADGFTLATGYVPQRFHIVLVRFDDTGVPFVERVEIAADNTASFEIPFTEDNRRTLMIIAASTPYTMTPAMYQFSISQ